VSSGRPHAILAGIGRQSKDQEARPIDDGRLTMTVEEAGRLLGIGRNLAYEAARRGEIPTVRLGRRMLVPTARLRELLGVQQSDH
jgi:excisionase family DNA binding protein